MPAKSPLHQAFCENTRARRQELGLTQTALAELLGMKPSAVSQIESGVSVPGLLLIGKIAKALQTTASELTHEHEPARL